MESKLLILLPEQWRILLFRDISIYNHWNLQLKRLEIDINFLDWNDRVKEKDLIIIPAFDLSIAEFILRCKRLENLFLINNCLENKFILDFSTRLLIYRSKKIINHWIKSKYYSKSLPNDIASYIQPAIQELLKTNNINF